MLPVNRDSSSSRRSRTLSLLTNPAHWGHRNWAKGCVFKGSGPYRVKKNIHNKKDLTVITTHINADFDALASMLAAQKLYPDALVVFPGSQEKNLRNFFINSMVYLFNMADIKDIDFTCIKRLVLVDVDIGSIKYG